MTDSRTSKEIGTRLEWRKHEADDDGCRWSLVLIGDHGEELWAVLSSPTILEVRSPSEPTQPLTTLSSPRSALWRHMHDEHGLTLLESELDEIELLAKACSAHEPPAEPVCEWCGGTKDQHDDPSTFRPRAAQPPDSAPIAPIAKLIVSEDDVVRAVMYAPGLPPGEHDLYPEGWLPDDHRDQTITSLCDRIERIFCIAIDQKLTHVERIKQIQEWSAGFMQPPCSTATKGNAP